MDLCGVRTGGAAPLADLQARAEIYFGMGIQGRTVADVGAWDGFYSFEAERRGASRVLAIDQFAWREGAGSKNGFDVAREILKSRVEDRVLDLPETTLENIGTWDIVLFNGIFYHIVDPIHALAEMVRIARSLVTVETHMDNQAIDRPVMTFFPGVENRPVGSPAHGWGPNSRLMHALLRQLGCADVLEFATPDNPDRRSIFMGFKPGHPFGSFVAQHQDKARPRFVGHDSEAPLSKAMATALMTNIAALEAEVGSLKNSTSWRATAPMRAIVDYIRRW